MVIFFYADLYKEAFSVFLSIHEASISSQFVKVLPLKDLQICDVHEVQMCHRNLFQNHSSPQYARAVSCEQQDLLYCGESLELQFELLANGEHFLAIQFAVKIGRHSLYL